ncbi:hypothetical protein E2320_001175, partial [Naja naja]
MPFYFRRGRRGL